MPARPSSASSPVEGFEAVAGRGVPRSRRRPRGRVGSGRLLEERGIDTSSLAEAADRGGVRGRPRSAGWPSTAGSPA